MSSDGSADIDAYLAGLAPEQRATLESLRASLREILPEAEEGLRYGAPCFSVGGKGVAGYAAFKDHCSYLPMSGSVVEAAGDALGGYATSKGAVQVPLGTKLPMSLLRKLVELRLAEIAG